MKLKPKYKFLAAADRLLAKGQPVDDLYEMAEKEYEGVTKDMVKETVERCIKAKATAGAIGMGAEQIYNDFDSLFIAEHPHMVVYRHSDNASFYEYRPDGYYHAVSDADIYNLVDRMMKHYKLDQRNSSRAVKDTICRIVSALSNSEGKLFTDESVERQPYYLNVKNGLLNLVSMTILSHTRDLFFQTQAPFAFDPTAEAPTFAMFIEQVSDGDPTTAQMIQEMFGYCLGHGNPKHKVFYLFGDTARNGKSTTAKILCGLLGTDNVSALSLAQLSGENTSIFMSLIGKQINFSDEVSSKFSESSRFTALISEGWVEVNPKFKKPFMYQIRAKFIITCNDLPNFKDSQGIKNRIISIPFTRHFKENERIDRYDEILLAKEGAGILNWAIAGMKLLERNKVFLINEKSQEDSHDNILSTNSAYAYLETMFDFGEYDDEWNAEKLYGVKERSAAGTVISGYRAFCDRSGVPEMTIFRMQKELSRFAKETGKIQQRRKMTGERFYVGLKEKPQSHEDF